MHGTRTIYVFFWNFIIFSKSIWKDCYCIKILFPFSLSWICTKVLPPEKRAFYRKSLRILLFDFVHGFLLFLKAFILYTNDNTWHYVEAKSWQGGMIFARSSSSILSIEEKPLGHLILGLNVCVVCVLPSAIHWNMIAFFLYFKRLLFK